MTTLRRRRGEPAGETDRNAIARKQFPDEIYVHYQDHGDGEVELVARISAEDIDAEFDGVAVATYRLEQVQTFLVERRLVAEDDPRD